MKLYDIKFVLTSGRMIIYEPNTNAFWSTVITRKFSSNTHYDTLGVSPQATNSEIKNAYYKKTKQYHPDINSTENAKKKFQDVSIAYETLSNYAERKKYDRTVIVKQGSSNVRPRYEQYSRPQASEYPPHRPTSPPKHQIYNFDMWYQEHYTRAFRVKQSQLKYDRFEEIKEDHEPNDGKHLAQAYVVLLFVIVVMNMEPLMESFSSLLPPKAKGKD